MSAAGPSSGGSTITNPDPPRLAECLESFRAALGDDALRTDDASRARYSRTTLVTGTAPAAIVYPATAEQVQAVVRSAAEHGVPLYPISRGKNWGYGNACAARSGQVIVDLSRLNRIHEVHEKLAYAVIEPGVTQGQLHDYLQQRHSGLWMDATGAGRDASILGNTVDRGFGHTPVGDHILNVAGLEVVLADGSLLRTGFAHFRNAQAGSVYRYGIGPLLDGLFSQSNFGIVTRATVWLMPKPESFGAFFVAAKREDALPDLVDRLMPLRVAGLLRSQVHIANDLRVFSSRMAYPWHLTGGQTLIPRAVRAQLGKEAGVGPWGASGGLYGSKAAIRAAMSTLKQAMRGYRVIFLNDFRLNLADRLLPVMPGNVGQQLRATFGVVKPLYGVLQGVPSDEFLRGVIWQSRRLDTVASLDPLDHDVGLIWVSPVVPAEGRHAQRAIQIMEPIYNRHGFDFLITLTLITERALACVTNITFDRTDADQTRRATACYDELMHALLDAGYPPYRTGLSGYAKLRDPAVNVDGDCFWQVCRSLKHTLDPGGIIAPGRYVE